MRFYGFKADELTTAEQRNLSSEGGSEAGLGAAQPRILSAWM